MAGMTPAEHYRAMADRIERNPPEEFAGAVLVVPPQGGDPVELLLTQAISNLALFWSTAKAMITVAAAEFEERARNNDPFRR